MTASLRRVEWTFDIEVRSQRTDRPVDENLSLSPIQEAARFELGEAGIAVIEYRQASLVAASTL
jgi:hypothetical protein